ncbi:MAG: response regulator [Gemmatimonadales bacterium]|nr:response regulator [Gemmatimonadales bacterium]
MADLLIVEHDPSVTETLRRACRSAGVFAEAVRDGAEALTLLDWHPPQVILCAGQLPDMWGWELCAVVRSDPKTERMPFVLLLDPEHLGRPEAQRCGASHLAPRAGGVGVVAELLPRLMPSRLRPAAAAASAATGVFQGPIGILGLPDLAQSIAGSGRAGSLILSLDGGQGILFFDGGRIVDAEFGARRGEAAVLELFERTEGQAGSFIFMPGEDLPRRGAIRKSVQQLLLDVATDLDVRRAQPIGDGPRPAPVNQG